MNNDTYLNGFIENNLDIIKKYNDVPGSKHFMVGCGVEFLITPRINDESGDYYILKANLNSPLINTSWLHPMFEKRFSSEFRLYAYLEYGLAEIYETILEKMHECMNRYDVSLTNVVQ